MYSYEMITEQELEHMTKEHLTTMYNEAVETILHLEQHIHELLEENEAVWASYDEISNQKFFIAVLFILFSSVVPYFRLSRLSKKSNSLILTSLKMADILALDWLNDWLRLTL